MSIVPTQAAASPPAGAAGAAVPAGRPDRPPVDASRDVRDVCGLFATGITVVTSGGDCAHGMTANSFTSVSLSPPLVLVCVDREAQLHRSVLATGSFAVSVLSAQQEHLARHFARRGRPRGLAQFDGTDWLPGARTGAPVLQGSLAWLECSLADVYDGGDHRIFLGRVLATGRSERRDALLFFGGQFRGLLAA